MAGKRKSLTADPSLVAVLQAQGLTAPQIAANLGVSDRTIYRRSAELAPTIEQARDVLQVEYQDWRARLKASSIDAVQRAVTDPDAIQPAGTLGLKVLVGLGELAGESSVQINTVIGEIPAGMRHMVRLPSPSDGE